MNSWQTTVFGGIILVGIFAYWIATLFDGDPNTTISIKEIIGSLIGLAGAGAAFMARDNLKTSEDVGAQTGVDADKLKG